MHATIVIAEDEPDIRTNLKMLLTLEGFTVHAAVNGEDALKLALEHRPDLVLSDVMMPVMTGHELVQGPARQHSDGADTSGVADRPCRSQRCA